MRYTRLLQVVLPLEGMNRSMCETQPAARMMLDVPGVLFVCVCVKNSKGSVSDSIPLLNRYTLGCVFICIKGLFHDRSQ